MRDVGTIVRRVPFCLQSGTDNIGSDETAAEPLSFDYTRRIPLGIIIIIIINIIIIDPPGDPPGLHMHRFNWPVSSSTDSLVVKTTRCPSSAPDPY
jgi:hypothetical protein